MDLDHVAERFTTVSPSPKRKVHKNKGAPLAEEFKDDVISIDFCSLNVYMVHVTIFNS